MDFKNALPPRLLHGGKPEGTDNPEKTMPWIDAVRARLTRKGNDCGYLMQQKSPVNLNADDTHTENLTSEDLPVP
jgi:hypothetical protein